MNIKLDVTLTLGFRPATARAVKVLDFSSPRLLCSYSLPEPRVKTGS